MTEQDDLLRDFLVESYENLDRLDGELITLEEDPEGSDVLSSIFRTIHTIKGTCGFLDFGRLEKLTHAGENLLSSLRDGELTADQNIVGSLLGLVDAVRASLGHIEATGEESNVDHGEIIAVLAAHRDRMPALGEVLEAVGLVTGEDIDSALSLQAEGDQRRLGEILSDQACVSKQEVKNALTAQADMSTPAEAPTPAGGIASNNIRVQVDQLDKLMNLAGELVLARNQILQLAAVTQDTETIATAQRLNLVTSELQEGIMKVRMQPIGVLWSKFPRLVRDLAQVCGKSMRLEMEGKNTELDKTLLEAIKDPLTHLVRNAVDHGVETSEDRVAAGKPAQGVLLLRAFHESGQVNIEIIDDGKGIDAASVKDKAVAQGLVTREVADKMSDRQALDLIFHAGLSTAKAVTNVSGRGVGMDVVKTNIDEIGGSVDINSEFGHGTTIRIKIPLTLAIIPALIVSTAGDRYAIPQVSLVELVRLEGAEAQSGIEDLHGCPVYRLRGELLPLVFLDRALEIEVMEGPSEGSDLVERVRNLVVVRADDRLFGLIVEEINDTEEIVVKSLDKQIKAVSVYAGTTILGDGRVALILDVLGLAQRARVITEGRHERRVAVADGDDVRSADIGTYLMLRGGGDRRMAIPLSCVDRLEEFKPERIEHTGNQEVVQYRDQIMPLVRVAELLNMTSISRTEEESDDLVKVIVHSSGSQSVGLVVDEISDIVESAATGRRDSDVRGIECAVVIDNQVTDLLDLDTLLEHVMARDVELASGSEAIADAAALADTSQFCTFHVGDLFFGVDVMNVQEVLRHQEMTRVPLTSDVVHGVINLRGQTVTALDMRERLALPERYEAGYTGDDIILPTNVVLRTEDGVVSILVDTIGDVVSVEESDKANLPETVDGTVRELVTSVYKLPGSLLLILDIDRLGAIDSPVLAS
ncbi:MAG: two-component system chemotaxis sensor kinase CheA [Chlamydiales bacterium]|jgi:two-component system chemotaxis sensor kinase CheA